MGGRRLSWLGRLFGPGRPETTRAQMDDALKRLVVPELRTAGFKGSMPHLRRRRDDGFDLLSFQYSKWGGAFAVEAARCGLDGVDAPTGPVPADKAKAWDMPRRYRVGPTGRAHTDHWYKFEHADPDEVAQRLLTHLGDPKLWEIADALPKEWGEE